MAEKTQHELALELQQLARQADKVGHEFEQRFEGLRVIPQGVFATATVERLPASSFVQELDGNQGAARAASALAKHS